MDDAELQEIRAKRLAQLQTQFRVKNYVYENARPSTDVSIIHEIYVIFKCTNSILFTCSLLHNMNIQQKINMINVLSFNSFQTMHLTL